MLAILGSKIAGDYIAKVVKVQRYQAARRTDITAHVDVAKEQQAVACSV